MKEKMRFLLILFEDGCSGVLKSLLSRIFQEVKIIILIFIDESARSYASNDNFLSLEHRSC